MRVRRAAPLSALLATLVLAGAGGGGRATVLSARAAPTVWPGWVVVDAAAPTPLRAIVVLGDSVPAGTGCGCAAFGWLLARGMPGPTSVTQRAGDGVTAAQLAADLRRPASPLAAVLRSADVITVTAGANDLLKAPPGGCGVSPCTPVALRELQANMYRLLSTMRSVAPTARIIVTGYWSVFLDGRVARKRGPAYVTRVDRLTRSVNSVLAAASRRAGASYVDLYAAFKGTGDRDDTALLAPDGDHPNAQGHQLIAATLLRALSG